MGFEMNEMEGVGHCFDYEGKHFLYMNNVDDDDFLSIAIPSLLEKEDVDDDFFQHLLGTLNSTLKYVKAYDIHDSLWLFYERELVGGEDFQALIRRMMLHLEASQVFFEHTMKAVKSSDEGDESEDVEADTISDGETDSTAEDDSDKASEDEAPTASDDETADGGGATEDEGGNINESGIKKGGMNDD